MKNLILLLAVALFSSTVTANDCVGGTCRQPLKKAAAKVVDVTRSVVTAPVKATRYVADNVRSRRYSRRCR